MSGKRAIPICRGMYESMSCITYFSYSFLFISQLEKIMSENHSLKKDNTTLKQKIQQMEAQSIRPRSARDSRYFIPLFQFLLVLSRT